MSARGWNVSRLRPSLWPALAVLAACIPFAGALSTTRIFHLRDLAMFFWPLHLWLRDALLAGTWPSWDPYAAGGQPTDPNALNQMFFPPVLLMRLLLPPVLGFNAIVATPFPLAALGMYLFLRVRLSRPSAAAGAIAFAAGGPMVSTGNFPNLSWSMAWLPWLLWALDRDMDRSTSRSLGIVSLVAALQMLSGEPVTMIGTLAIATAYALTRESAATGFRVGTRRLVRFGLGVAIAGGIASVQLVPTTLAAGDSLRSIGRESTYTFWSLHPLWLTEAVLPQIFGHAFENWQSEIPWLWPLNSGRDPLFYSLYVGGLVAVLAIVGMRAGDRRLARFWLVVGVISLFCAFGGYTPFYAVLQTVLPLVRSFRFPVKFFLFAAFALAVLAAEGVEAWMDPLRGATASRVVTRTTVVGCILLAALIGAFVLAPFTAARAAFELGRVVELADPVKGAEYLFRSVSSVAVRALALFALATWLAYLALTRSERRAWAAGAFCFVAVFDLLAINAWQNPLMDASRLGPPTWTRAAKARPAERFYFGGKFGGKLVTEDPDVGQTGWDMPPDTSLVEARTLFMSQLVMSPAAWGVREILSHDLPLLRAKVQMEPILPFMGSNRVTRLRFLERTGVRYCVFGDGANLGAVPVARLDNGFRGSALYECVPNARRAYVVPDAHIEPSKSAAALRLFDADFPADSAVMLEREAGAPSGIAGSPAAASARIVVDEDQRVEIEATVSDAGGYLVLLDTFDPTWKVEVDGVPATLMRANGFFRAVRLVPGTHRVRFEHQHTLLKTWLPVSAAGGLVLLLVLAHGGPRRRDSEPASVAEPRAA